MKLSVSLIAVLASGLLLASSVAAKPPGGGGGYQNFPNYWVSVDPHPDWNPAPDSPVYDPDPECLGLNPDPVFWVDMPRLVCSTITTSEGHQIHDHVRFIVRTDGNGDIYSVQIQGGDDAGRLHMSDVISIDPPQTPVLGGDFTLHVDTDNVTIWGCDGNLKSKNFKCENAVGTISLGDLTYACFEGCSEP